MSGSWHPCKVLRTREWSASSGHHSPHRSGDSYGERTWMVTQVSEGCQTGTSVTRSLVCSINSQPFGVLARLTTGPTVLLLAFSLHKVPLNENMKVALTFPPQASDVSPDIASTPCTNSSAPWRPKSHGPCITNKDVSWSSIISCIHKDAAKASCVSGLQMTSVP